MTVTDYLNDVNISNTILVVEKTTFQLDHLYPFITHCKENDREYLMLVQNFNSGQFLIDGEEIEHLGKDEFFKKWTGLMICLDEVTKNVTFKGIPNAIKRIFLKFRQQSEVSSSSNPLKLNHHTQTLHYILA
ncbi:hypothetical protein [Pedobacter psychrotolerans]|nr:hypothetical protein [Pedobacter psychrotolerans]GGE51806.1 hypothetical protein GCM10011413_17690 [Pedobacter psychrotolerans]